MSVQSKYFKFALYLAVVGVIGLAVMVTKNKPADAGHCQASFCVCIPLPSNDPLTRATIAEQHLETIEHFMAEFDAWEPWLIEVFFDDHFLPALMYMTNQIVATAMHQVFIIGTFFDAKHQLEVQDLFRKKLIEAHRDYHPSTGMCILGTNMRSLTDAARRTDVTAHILGQRSLERQMGARDVGAAEGPHTDKKGRLEQFRTRYCSIHDNSGNMDAICPGGSAPANTVNKDVNFMNTVDRALTLQLDFTDDIMSEDEQDVMALASNLYAHDVFYRIPESTFIFGSRETSPYRDEILDIRSIVAKRSVAENSFNRIVALRSMGSPADARGTTNSVETAEYMTILLQELGIPEADIPQLLGGVDDGEPVRPSYYAQMDLLTKKVLQNPSFFVDLYDKPANVERKSTTLQAIKNMQDFDTLESVLRTEAMLAILLETKLMDAQEAVQNKLNLMDTVGIEN